MHYAGDRPPAVDPGVNVVTETLAIPHGSSIGRGTDYSQGFAALGESEGHLAPRRARTGSQGAAPPLSPFTDVLRPDAPRVSQNL